MMSLWNFEKLGEDVNMKIQYLIGVICFLNTLVCSGAELYQSEVTFLSNAERQIQLERLESIEILSENEYLTQMALQKPNVFIRQLERARSVLQQGGEVELVSRRLRTEGFFSPEVQLIFTRFISLLDPADLMTESRVIHFLVMLNNELDTWSYLFNPDLLLDDYAALECAPEKAPAEFLGPEDYQYLLQVAHPNMEISLWRFDATEAIIYPVATLAETTVEKYDFINRFGQKFGLLNRNNLVLIDANGQAVQCHKIEPSIFRAYQDYRREIILSEKQL